MSTATIGTKLSPLCIRTDLCTSLEYRSLLSVGELNPVAMLVGVAILVGVTEVGVAPASGSVPTKSIPNCPN